MIKYLELTAPEESQFRQAKILSIAVSEGDEVNAGDTLFKVQSGSSEVDLPSRLAGRIVEVIVGEGENISYMTPLVLLETEVEGSTATKPLVNGEQPSEPQDEAAEATKSTKGKKKSSKKKDSKKAAKKAAKKAKKARKAKKMASQLAKRLEQQSLDLGETDEPGTILTEPEVEVAAEQAHNATENLSNDATKQTENTTMSSIKINVPDIGIDSAKVIEVLVNVGDTVSVDEPLITLESDKASMDVPSTADGVIESIEVALDQDVSEGDLILTLASSVAAAESAAEEPAAPPAQEAEAPAPAPQEAAPAAGATADVTVPDIGGDSAKVIEILVNVGDSVEIDDPLITLESDKASMDVPSTVAGTIESIEVELEQDASEGTLIARIASSGGAAAPAAAETPNQAPSPAPAAAPAPAPAAPAPAAHAKSEAPATGGKSHASPSVRRFARELGADLSKVQGSGRKGRVTKDDVKQFVKGVLTSGNTGGAAASSGAGIPEVPAVDFSKFGEIEVQPLNKIKRLTAANLHRSWLNVPHVTHNDESNISDLESFRKQLNEEYQKQGKPIKLSPLAFIVKAVVNAMQTYPQFNASLEPGGENLILKKYFHIGIAVDTPNGLVVPVIRNADTKSVAEIATEMGELAAKARDKKLTPADMSGACFTISSLGGIGGTGFTPIVNAPEVAILGVSRSKIQPVWNGSEFEPGMMLPLSLSYDHRVIDGAEAARFTRQIAAVLEDVRRLAV